jgi:YD repeat-containing protein
VIVDDQQRVIGEVVRIGTTYEGTRTCVAAGRQRLRCVRAEPGGRVESDAQLRRGRVTRWREADTEWTFRYDSAGRLVRDSVAVDGHLTARSWTYDAAGRMVEEKSGEVTTTFDYDASGRLVAMRARGPDATRVTDVRWDPSGGEAVVTDETSSTTWRFDQRGRVLSAEEVLRAGVVGGFGKAEYRYECPGLSAAEPQLAR